MRGGIRQLFLFGQFGRFVGGVIQGRLVFHGHAGCALAVLGHLTRQGSCFVAAYFCGLRYGGHLALPQKL